MPVARVARKISSERACLECQKRKTRCVPSAGDGGQPCVYCARTQRSCVFEEPQERTPLTRRNLDSAEARCRELEELLQRMQSGSSCEAASAPTVPAAENDQPATVPPTAAPYEWTEVQDSGGERERSSDDENARDGMAALANKGRGSGYLGTGSGYDILQSVSSLVPSQDIAERQAPQTEAPITPASNVSRVSGAALCSSAFLTASVVQSQLVDAYFLGYNAYYPVLHEGTFRRELSRRKEIGARKPWHITYYTVLAIGEWVSGHGEDDTSLYSEAARARLTPEVLESGSMHTVQAFLLLGNYLQKRDRPNTAYNYIGIALRMAMGLGLHKELAPASHSITFEQHRRRMIFWILYCFDCWFNITTGRPALLSDSAFDTRLPANVDEWQCETLSAPAVEVFEPTVCSTIIALSKLTKIANRIHTRFMCANTSMDVEHEATVLEHMIHNWRASLPAYFSSSDAPSWFMGPRQIVFWKESNLLVLLLLLSQRALEDERDKVAIGARCESIAVNTIGDISLFCRTHANLVHSGLGWYVVYFTLQAMLSYSAQRIYKHRLLPKSPIEDLQQYEQTADIACQCLQNLASGSKAASRSLRIIPRLRNMVRRTANDPRQQNIHATPSSGVHMDSTSGVSGMPSASGAGGHLFDASILTQDVHRQNFGFGAQESGHTLPDLVLSEWGSIADPSLQALFDDATYFGGSAFFGTESMHDPASE